MDIPRLLIIVNPAVLRGDAGAGFARLRAVLPEHAAVVRETIGDGRDAERIGEWLTVLRPPAVVAAGGDGTVRAVACALMERPAPARPALGLLPLGTANNVARSLGFSRLDPASAPAAAAALLGDATRPLDLGRANGAWFVGSCAAGMDAAILAARNRWCARWHLGRQLGGYPLYLLACAVGLARHRAVVADLRFDGGTAGTQPVHNLLVLNTALYAGEFRFDSGDLSADGRLDVHTFAHAAAYVRGFVTAWRRHLGAAVAPPPLHRVATLSAHFAEPIALQLDGEEAGRVRELAIEVVPAALHILCGPPRSSVADSE
ncbi:MAG TPA: diacylglycerol kinase family protein [Candidatus Dormibacteraeota bacterium]|nr:diacylglycerol kinase family protein [Candidatus Dormibacteraeota bacterium]